MRRRPPISTRTDTLLPYTTLFRSGSAGLSHRRDLPDSNPDCPQRGRNDSARSAGRHRLLGGGGGRPHLVPQAARTRWTDQPYRHHVSRRNLKKLCRSEEHTSELQSLMRISYAVFCSKTKKNTTQM